MKKVQKDKSPTKRKNAEGERLVVVKPVENIRNITETVPFQVTRTYLREDFIFYFMIFTEYTEIKDIAFCIVQKMHTLRRLESIAEFDEGNHALAYEMFVSLGSENHHGQVCYRLAYMLHNGKGVGKDKPRARELYIQAMELLGDSPLDNFYRGVIYKDGLSGVQDINKAIEFYKRSSDSGCPSAQINLGSCYRTGTGVPKDLVKACELFKKAADSGSALGQCHIGYMNEFGFGVSKNKDEAIRYYKMAADKKHEYALQRLSKIEGTHDAK